MLEITLLTSWSSELEDELEPDENPLPKVEPKLPEENPLDPEDPPLTEWELKLDSFEEENPWKDVWLFSPS